MVAGLGMDILVCVCIYIYIYIYQLVSVMTQDCIVLKSIYLVSAAWTLVGSAEAVSVVIVVYSAH